MGFMHNMDAMYAQLRWKIKRQIRVQNIKKEANSKIMRGGLSKQEIKQIKDYYAPYCKAATYPHSFLKSVTGEFHLEYIPEEILKEVFAKHF